MPDICGFMPMDKIIKGVLVADVLSLAGVQPPPSALKVRQHACVFPFFIVVSGFEFRLYSRFSDRYMKKSYECTQACKIRSQHTHTTLPTRSAPAWRNQSAKKPVHPPR